MRQIPVAALFLAALAAAPPAHADSEVAVRVSTEFSGDSGLYATGSTKNLVQGELGYAHTVRSYRRGQIWLEGSWTIGERHDRLFGAFDTSVLAQQFTVGVRGTVPIRPWLVPQLRAGVGALLGSLRMNNLASGALDQTSAAFTTYVLAGLQFLLPRPWMSRSGERGITAGVVVEGGYCYSTELHYSLSPAPSSSTVQMPSASTDLGALSLSGAILRVGVLLRF